MGEIGQGRCGWGLGRGPALAGGKQNLTLNPNPNHKPNPYPCQKTDDFHLGRGHYPLLSYCLPGSPMNQANTRKLERDHTENVKRRVRVKKVFPPSLNHFCLLLVDNITSDRGPVRFGPVRFGPLYKIYFCPTKHQ